MAREFKTGVKITGDASGAVSATRATRAELDKFSTSVQKQTRHTQAASASITQFAAKQLALGAAVSAVFYGFSKTAIETEKLRGSLVTMVGDVTRAGVAFDALSAFASRTPFTLDQSVQAFIKMKSLGLEPTENALQSFGNTAAAMGKDMSQMIEAVADASTMEFERLKEFGIKARQEGDNVSFTFQGTTTTVRKNSGEIVKYLESIGNTQFAGAMENQMQRLPGLLSNLQDNISGLFRAFGDVGGITLMGNAIRWASGLLADFTETIRSGELIDEMSMRWEQFAGTLSDSWSDLSDSWSQMTGDLSVDFEGTFLSIGNTIDRFVESQSNTGERFISRWLDALALLPVFFQEMFGAIITIVASSFLRMKDELNIWLKNVEIKLADFKVTVSGVYDKITGNTAARAAAHQQSVKNITDEIAQLEEHQRILAADSDAALTFAANNVLAAKQKMTADRAAAAAQRELDEAAKKSGLTLDDLAKSTSGASAEVAGLTTEAKAALKALESLTDRLDPLAKLGRQFTVEQAILAGKIAEGGDQLAYYTQLLEILKTQYAEAAREAVGFGDKAGAAAEKAAARAAAAAKKEADARAEGLAKQAADQDAFGVAFRRGIERLDDLGADLWKGWFTGAKSAMQSIKDYFLNWLAELANAAITRPIQISIMAALGLGGSGTAAAGGIGGGGIGGIGSIAGVGGSGGGIGGIGSIGQLLTGGGIGNAFVNLGGSLPTWLGGTAGTGVLGPTAAGGNISGGIFSNAGGVSNLAYGVAGIVAGVLGQKIFGGYGGIGASLGATIGTAILPGIGTVIGGLLGGALGGLLGPKNNPPKLSAAGTEVAAESPYASGKDSTIRTAFGDVFLRVKRFSSEIIGELQTSITDFDASVAQFLTKDQIAEASDRLKTWSTQMEGTAISLEDLLRSRFEVILSTFSEDVRNYVHEVADLGDEVQRLAMASTAQQIIDAAPDLFKGKTFRDFIAVAESMQQSGEDLTDTFKRLAQEVATIADELTFIKGYSTSNLAEDFDNLIKQQGVTLREYASGLGDEIRGLAATFTGSEDDLARLSTLVSQRYDSEIAYLAQIKQISDGISAGFQSTKDQIEQDLLGPEAYYQKITGQAEELAKKLKTLTDPSQIAQTVAEIQRLTGQAYSLLDEQGKKANGQGFLDFISGVESDAQSALTTAKDLFIEESQVLRDLVSEMAQDFADPLEIAAAAHVSAAGDLQDAAASISSAAGGLGNLGRSLVSAVGSGFNALVTAVNTSVATTTTPAPVTGTGGGSSGGTKNPSTLDSLAASSILKTGQATVQAIQKIGRPSVQVIMPGRGMVTGY